jgi:hypothetical protein
MSERPPKRKVRRKSRSGAAPQEPRGGAAKSVRGDLELFGLPEIVQTLTLGMKTACVVLRNGRRRGRIWFAEGAALHARTGKLLGDVAFFELMSWTQGSFTIEPGRTTRQRTLGSDALYLLMEGARRLDESTATAPAARAITTPDPPAPERPSAATPALEVTDEMREEIDDLLVDLVPRPAPAAPATPSPPHRKPAVRVLSRRLAALRAKVAARASVAGACDERRSGTAAPAEVTALREALFG